MIPNDVATYNLALSNFEYVADINQYRVEEYWARFGRIDRVFRGDCEDFAFTLQYQIGGEVWHVILPKSRLHHAVLVKDYYVYDQIKDSPIPLIEYDGAFLGLMDYETKTTKIKGINYGRLENYSKEKTGWYAR